MFGLHLKLHDSKYRDLLTILRERSLRLVVIKGGPSWPQQENFKVDFKVILTLELKIC